MQPRSNRKQKSDKAKPGTVQIRCSNGRLQLVFRFGGKRYFISLGLSDTSYHRKLAQDKALEIERDIQYGEFDPTLQKSRFSISAKALDWKPHHARSHPLSSLKQHSQRRFSRGEASPTPPLTQPQTQQTLNPTI
jgi:hypothetical protein